MKNYFSMFLLGFSLSAIPFVAFSQTQVMPKDVSVLTDSLKKIYAPDKRVDLFSADYTINGKKLMLQGNTTSAKAHNSLISGLKQYGYEVMDCMKVFPSEDLGDKVYGIVDVSVCNIRSSADFSSEMITQSLLGTPVKVLEKDGWLHIQTPDRYLGWVHSVGVYQVNEQELHAWNRAEKVVVTDHYGWVYEKPDIKSQHISDVVAGNRLRFEGQHGKFYKVSYPNGRKGYILKEQAQLESFWRKNLKKDAESILGTAKTMMGVPYLWAGMSSKGVDCSGFVRTILYMHDIIIPRDASQQCLRGDRIEIASDFSNLIPGDLIFFGSKATNQRKERVVHVALYLGNKRFIHSQGDVHISSFDINDELYDSYNLNRLLFAARILPYVGIDPEMNTTATNSFYNY